MNECCSGVTIVEDVPNLVVVINQGPQGPAGVSSISSKIVTADYTMTIDDQFIVVDSSSPVVITLLPLPAAHDIFVVIKRIGTGDVSIIGPIAAVDEGPNALLNSPISREALSLFSQNGSYYVW